MNLRQFSAATDASAAKRAFEHEADPQPAAGEPGRASFEEMVLPHLGAAYSLACWLTGDKHRAEDVVQESYLRALRFFAGFRGDNSRPWLLAIVRNTYFTHLRHSRSSHLETELNEEVHSLDRLEDAETMLVANARRQTVRRAIESLPAEFREVIILREMEELSYREIADLVSIPIGTVMSRLARARARLQKVLTVMTTSGAEI